MKILFHNSRSRQVFAGLLVPIYLEILTWVIDGSKISSVKKYREPMSGHPTGPDGNGF
jgi:hypothetical protein